MSDEELEQTELESGTRSRLGIARIAIWALVFYTAILMVVSIYLAFRRH